ncbi:ABC transporter substrate-binding protein [Chitinophaga sp. CF118]|uniref:ABC transporter substrate-binding protein n=1 Tax=Chitinophaga sp. CF118 TaxID=1884367 RepID=UPI000B7EAFDC|nr:ABC transporter substrate-binding protein [Chitinophaga sp. CF118]
MSKSNICSHLLAVCTLAVLLSACSASRKSSKTATPLPTVSKPVPEEKKKDNGKKEEKAAPFNVAAFGREVKKDVYNIALFSPLYLDSVFSTSTDIPGRTLPRYVLPGLDFYEGSQLALDSLQQQGIKLNVVIYDSKGRQNNPQTLLRNKSLDSTDLIIAAVGTPELKELSDVARGKEINMISATYPNDGGITGNPFLLITNSLLKTHCEAIQHYAQEGFATKNILLFHRNSTFEKHLVADFKADYEKTNSSKKSRIREVIWNDSTSETELAQYLLADRPNICIITALDETSAKDILRKLSVQMANYPLQVFGMPTWDIMKFREPEFKGMQIYYTSPYFNDKTDVYSRYITDYFKRVYKSRPSDMAFKGFELTWYFVKQLTDKGVYFNTNVNDPSKRVFSNFNYQPVYLKEGESIPDYFENKNIYIIQKGDSSDIKMNIQ